LKERQRGDRSDKKKRKKGGRSYWITLRTGEDILI
jgi:hypothetical protein